MNSAESGISFHYKLSRGTGFDLDLQCQLPSSGLTAIYGRSGSGKTTLLRCIAGLEPGATGFFQINQQRWQDQQCFLPTHQRDLAYVFQQPGLFPHLSVSQNLAYGMRRRGEKTSADYYQRIVEVVGIAGLVNRMPSGLSGGEAQRVAIARALLCQPALLLMDEPLSSLDSERKQELLPYLEHLSGDFNLPILYVSHSRAEVARLADQVLVLDQGRLVGLGTAAAMFNQLDSPLSRGRQPMALLNAHIAEVNQDWNLARAELAATKTAGSLWIKNQQFECGQRLRLQVMARDVSLTLSDHADSSIINRLPVQVEAIETQSEPGAGVVKLRWGEQVLFAQLTLRSISHLGLQPDMKVWAQLKSVAVTR